MKTFNLVMNREPTVLDDQNVTLLFSKSDFSSSIFRVSIASNNGNTKMVFMIIVFY